MQFNCSKSTCTAIGPGAAHSISDMQLGSSFISWSSSFKYLGITFIGGKKLSVDVNVIKRKFYAACNCIFGKTCSLDEILRLSLQESYCLPVLEYATAAIRLSKYQVLELNVCCNSIFRKIFGFAKHESVRAFIFGLSRLDFLHLHMMLSYKFIKHPLCNSNNVLLSVARLRRLSKDFKTFESHIAATCEVEFCSVGLLQKAIRRRFEESLL